MIKNHKTGIDIFLHFQAAKIDENCKIPILEIFSIKTQNVLCRKNELYMAEKRMKKSKKGALIFCVAAQKWQSCQLLYVRCGMMEIQTAQDAP